MQQAAACHPAGESSSPCSLGRALAHALLCARMPCLCPVAHLPCPCCCLPAHSRTPAKQARLRAVGSSTYQAFSLAAHHQGAWIGMDTLTLLGHICPTHNQKPALEPRFSGGFYPSPLWDAADMAQLFSTSWEAATNIPASSQDRLFFP